MFVFINFDLVLNLFRGFDQNHDDGKMSGALHVCKQSGPPADGLIGVTMSLHLISVALRRALAKNFAGNGVCRPAWENRLTISALMTPTNKTTFAGAL
jgi:hypothetical protein